MKWSLRIARVAGIDIRVHVSFVLTLLLGAYQFSHHYGPAGVGFGVVLMLALFACVTLHELGHSLVAQRFGGVVREIVLLPIGGVARLTREPVRPVHELLVAAAGPAVNVVIAAVLFVSLRAPFSNFGNYLQMLLAEPNLLAMGGWLLLGNVSLALFNMIPALPMDGGRVLRAVLAMLLGRQRATIIAAGVGQALALGMVAIGVLSPAPVLALIGLFVFLGAAQERDTSRSAQALSQLSAGEVCDPSAILLSPTDDLGDLVDHALRNAQSSYAVVHGTELVGVVLRDEAVAAVPRLGLRASLSEVLRRDLTAVEAETPLVELRARIVERGLPVVVTEGRRFMGVLGMEDLARIAGLSRRLAAAGIRRPRGEVLPAAVSASRWPPGAAG
jgi:Zn-dependent protease